MTLRDWFAGQALSALVARHRADVPWSGIGPTAYELADAMLSARKGVSPAYAIARLTAALTEMTETYWGVDDDHNGDGRGETPMVIVRAREALALVRSENGDA
jgi:hypothetical protein